MTIRLENRHGALAEMGEAPDSAGVSIEGGGAFVVDGKGIAHLLFEGTLAARKALEANGETDEEPNKKGEMFMNQIARRTSSIFEGGEFIVG